MVQYLNLCGCEQKCRRSINLMHYSEDDEDEFLDNRKQKRLMINLNDQKPLEEIIHNEICKHMEISPSRKRKRRQQLIPRHDHECLTSPEAY
ncbi:unnamed protein product [Didymodactylos carnosus]|uniref:Uncharacterized protein n=1 Tax=Didymodactylos carnosus TaxID=1234261 RepID=A0A815BER8_9BILA|nr:unnamed protein product [Didymodactylos carnosus]CAF4050175.1 unnamed protein product [Didymodactylos carnosus]